MEKTTYAVDTPRFNQYLKGVNKRERLVGFIVFALVISCYIFLIRVLSPDLPLGFYLLYLVVVCALVWGALTWREKIENKMLNGYREAIYVVTTDELRLICSGKKDKVIRLDKVVLVHKSSKGTMVVEGDFWTWLRYYHPLTNNHSLDFYDRIFIPSVTGNYEELHGYIKRMTRK